MSNSDRNVLLAIGGLALLGWLFTKDKYKCPRCNNPITKNMTHCPNCGQPFVWEDRK